MNRFFCILDYKNDIKSLKDMYNEFSDSSYLTKNNKDNVNKKDIIYVGIINLPDNSSRLFLRTVVKEITDDYIKIWSIRGIPNTFYKKYNIDNNEYITRMINELNKEISVQIDKLIAR